MSQQNYFTYNIIDTLYFNQPVGEEMENMYGIPAGFKRRNPIEYNNMSAIEKQAYDELEKKFIKAVVDKYLMDDFGNGTYIGIDTYARDTLGKGDSITYTYFKSTHEMGIELSDMLSNVNGTHNYKLISAKDIDFDNIILPNSAIDRPFNWGGFDENRRWGDKPIHINNTFELLNVIDYLLCACDNLWNELYKIKYNSNVGVQIWFCKDATDNVLIHYSNALSAQDFMINSDRSNTTKMITYLDPFNYYTSLNNNPDNKFGIVTNFYKTNDDGDLFFDRKIVDIRNKNIVLMTILPSSKEIIDSSANINQNINGQLQKIYGYVIGDELKIYPGSRIDTFNDDNNVIIDSNALIDFTNNKLKSDTFFKSDSANSIYSKVYVKFLDESVIQQKSNLITTKPYILYYINNDNKKVILSCNHKNNNTNNCGDLETCLMNNLPSVDNGGDYIWFDKTGGNIFTDSVVIDTDENNQPITYPKYYVMIDEFYTTLEVATPNSLAFSAGSRSITIYYYKNKNNINCSITRLNSQTNTDVEVLPEEDITQKMSLTYHDFRYNVPDNEDITFTFDATYIALSGANIPDNDINNPLHLKLDDEYDDIMLFVNSNDYRNITSDAEASKYYKMNAADTVSPFKRNFEQFTLDTFNSNKNNYLSFDNNSRQYKHVWQKNESPYKLNLTIENDELINQSLSKSDITTEINRIKTNNEFEQLTYNTYHFRHTLSDGVEQIKLNLRFSINETSKVKSAECIIPLNINKIYNPTINYYVKDALTLENANYDNVIYSVGGNSTITLKELYENMFGKYGSNILSFGLANIPDIGKHMYGDDNNSLNSLDDLLEPKTYDCNVNNALFKISYNTTFNIINLLGGWYTEKYVESSAFSNHGFAKIELNISGNNPKNILLNDIQSSMHPYIFNFNGFGRNYRLHGNGSTAPENTISTETAKKYYKDYDLISVATTNSNVSIAKQLKIKLTDGDNSESNYQLKNIATTSDENQNIWTNNNIIFNTGISTQSSINNEEGDESNEYKIYTMPINICKTTYQVNCPLNFDANDNNQQYITYYVPITYMYINSSTFYPPLSTLPSNDHIVHDMNDVTDRARYNQYIKCWDTESDSNYHPITLSLKLFDNTSVTSPYYYESNEAVMKFNIMRTSNQNAININGLDKIIYVALGSKYYLSDFIKVGAINENSNLNNSQLQQQLLTSHPSGSYFFYDETVGMYTVNEIPANYTHQVFSQSHNSHYKYCNIGGDSLTNPDFESVSANENPRIPYPIFIKPNEIINEDESKTYEYNPDDVNVQYDYDIYRIADINKINLDINSGAAFTTNIVSIQNLNGGINTGNYATNGTSAFGLTTNTDTFCVDFGIDFKNNFAENTIATGNNNFNVILYHIDYGQIYNSKNYLSSFSTASGTNTIISPIIRKKATEGQYANLEMYYKVEYIGGNDVNKQGYYEFFEFKYSNVYEIRRDNSSSEWNTIISLAPGDTYDGNILTPQSAYDKQLNLFLSSNAIDATTVICDITFANLCGLSINSESSSIEINE